MTKEDIDKAAIRAIRKHYICAGSPPCSELENCRFCSGKNTAYDCNECGADEFLEGFLIAAEWRINSVWHDASEIPQHSGLLIAICKDGKAVLCGPNNSNWEITVKIFHIVRWAYLDDLLPERKEKSK